jgi:hypothetical protein
MNCKKYKRRRTHPRKPAAAAREALQKVPLNLSFV